MEQDYLCISWKDLPWMLFKRKVFRTQCNIYKAKKNGNYKQVSRLQKLLINSKSSHFIAVKFLVDSFSRRGLTLSHTQVYSIVKKLKGLLKNSLYFNKIDSGIPSESLETITSVVIQFILKLALEPIYSLKSNWFLMKESKTLLLINKKIKLYLKSNFNCNILKFSLDSSSGDKSRSFFMKKLDLPVYYKVVLSNYLRKGLLTTCWLKDGLGEFLRDILLLGIENLNKIGQDNSFNSCGFVLNRFAFRHSDTVIYFLKKKENFYDLTVKIKNFLKDRGLVLDLSSVFISNMENGFGFFEWFFRKFKTEKKVSILSDRRSWILYRKVFKSVLNGNLQIGIKTRRLNLLFTNWIRVHSFCSKFDLRVKKYYIKNLLIKHWRTMKFDVKRFLLQSMKIDFSFFKAFY